MQLHSVPFYALALQHSLGCNFSRPSRNAHYLSIFLESYNHYPGMEPQPSLYDLLGVPRTATPSEITKAYRLMALRVHPDKHPEDHEAASRNFIRLQEAYSILNNADRRRVYDLTGDTDEDSSAFFEAYNYYREKFPKVRTEDIEEFGRTYKGSEEEKEDLKQFYEERAGDVTRILEFIILSEEADVGRFVGILEEFIKKGELKRTKKFERSKKKVAKLIDEGDDTAGPPAPKKALPSSDLTDLMSQIRENSSRRAEFLTEMEAHYKSEPAKRRKRGKK